MTVQVKKTDSKEEDMSIKAKKKVLDFDDDDVVLLLGTKLGNPEQP